MDIVVHQTNSAVYSETEDETRWAVNNVLQKLIIDVEDLLKHNGSDYVDNSSTLQDDLSAKTDQIYYDNLDILMKSSECKIGMNFEPPDQDVSARNILYEDNQSDLLRSTELITNSSPEEVHPAVCNEQINQDGNQNICSINVDLEDSTNGLSSGGENRERGSTDLALRSANNSFNRRTMNSSEDEQVSEELSDSDEEDFMDEIGDHEIEANLDDVTLIQRIIQYMRETDMLLIANRGGGDVLYDTDDDMDFESDGSGDGNLD